MIRTRHASSGVTLLVAVAFAACGPAWAAGEEEAACLLRGEWHGSSICTDRVRAPACKDEEVVYRFSRPEPPAPPVPPAPPNTTGLHLAADKIVDGVAQPMGEFDLSFDAATKRWISEVQTPRVHVLWSFDCDGASLTGTLVELPSQALLRRVAAERREPSEPEP